jgi:hypothetical protein
MMTIPMTRDMHMKDHELLLDGMLEVIINHRTSIGVESSWVLEPRICCVDEMPTQEGAIWWDAEVRYARMLVRCDLPPALFVWVIVHELYELLRWETADTFMTLAVRSRINRQFNRYLQETYRAARNREIELLVCRHLGYRRPGHLMEEITVASAPITLYASTQEEPMKGVC